MVNCDICGKEFKNTQGLRGHKYFVHQLTNSSSESAAPPATEQEPSDLKERINKLEDITGITAIYELGETPGNTYQPLTEQVAELTQQVGQLSEQLDEPAEELELSTITEAMLNESEMEHKRQIEQLGRECEDTHNKLVGIVNKNGELVRKGLSIAEDGTKAANKRFNDLLNRFGQLEEQVQTKLALSSKLSDRLDAIEQKLADFRGELSVVRNLMRRQPTGKKVRHPLYEAHSRNYKEYRDPEGLARPYRHSRDLIFGDRWIDLAEPED